MPDYRTLFDSDWIRAWDLAGKARTLTIVKVEGGTIENPKAKTKTRKPVVHFKGAKKPLALNKTNAATIADMFGNDTDAWVGKTITIFPTTTSFGRETVDCIRINPKASNGKAAETLPDVAPPPDPMTAEDARADREPGIEG